VQLDNFNPKYSCRSFRVTSSSGIASGDESWDEMVPPKGRDDPPAWLFGIKKKE